MLEKLLQYLENKKILILGFGVEGESSYNFFREHFPENKICIADKNENLLQEHTYLAKDNNLELNLGQKYLDDINNYDLILKTPGISFKDVDITGVEEKITNQLELLLEYVDIFTIGITGTKGKSTTSSLIYKVLKEQEKDVFLLGNIGDPIFNNIDMLEKDSIVVLEISSHALEYVNKSPNISILLNIYEEHLDHYKSLDKYIEAKFNIAKYQKEEDFLIYNYENELMNKYRYNYRNTDYAVSENEIFEARNKIYLKEKDIYCNEQKVMSIEEDLKLKGMHNFNNIMFVIAVCDILKLNFDKALDTIRNFDPLEHRMEFVATINRVDYYNDSIATIPEATINAVTAIKDVNTIILGGKDRGINLNRLISFLLESDVENIICLPKTGEYIYEKLKNTNKKCYYIQNLQEAVNKAKEVTKESKVCILSPAASSYGYFKNFEERGRLFKKYVIGY